MLNLNNIEKLNGNPNIFTRARARARRQTNQIYKYKQGPSKISANDMCYYIFKINMINYKNEIEDLEECLDEDSN